MSVRDYLYHPVSGKTNNLLLFIISILPAVVLFSFPAAVFSNGIDPPLAWVFNTLIHSEMLLGRDIVFPHGPLAFMMYPLPLGANLWIAVSIHLLARTFMAYSLLKLATRKPLGYLLFSLAGACILLSVNDLLLTIVQIVILCYLNFFERRNIWWLIPALIITPLTLFIKAFVGIVSLIVTLTFAGIMLFRTFIGIESRYRLLMLLIVPFVLPVTWAIMYGNLHGFGGYMNGMMELAADNSAAVAVYPNNNWWILGIAFSSGLALIILNLKTITLGRFSILAAPALFAIWKYGMAREDFQHASVLFIFVLFIVLVYNVLSGKLRVGNIVLSIVIVVAFYFSLMNSFYYEPFQPRVKGIQTIFAKVMNNRYFADTSNFSSAKNIERNCLDKNILDIIGNETSDVYPWDYSYLAANQLNWKPRPVLQSYASYTRVLDDLNAEHFNSENAPEFLIWELQKITHDIHGGTLESIDGRYLLNDEPDALLSMFCHYTLVAKQGGTFPALIYRRRAEVLHTDTKVLKLDQSTWNTWMDVPDVSGGIIRASVDLKRSLAGNMKSFFYKDEAVFVYYLLENGDIRMYRIVPKTAAYGLWINPLIVNPEAGKQEPVVKKIMFRCSDKTMMKEKIGIEWYEVTFTSGNEKQAPKGERVYPVYGFFGIKESNTQQEWLHSTNDLSAGVEHWSVADESKIRVSASNRSLQLSPDDYSVSYTYSLDSLTDSILTSKLIVRTGVWAKADQRAKGVFVISIEKANEVLTWKAVDIQGFLHDENAMNFVCNYAVLDEELLSKKGLTLKIYAWNTGSEIIELDDFSVRVEGR